MEATVLSLTWPRDFDLSNLNRFESEARRLRYQALGRACREQKIQALMLAHHGDDQAETVMMRLATNKVRSGLQAMQRIGWIPECEGIYGLHHSGEGQRPDASLNIPFPVEQGGIQILRPLLGFEKSRLIATCEENGVPWAEDKTNQIQTLTSRNAIRHIYKHHKLPEALSIKSLVRVSLGMQKRAESHKAYAEKLFDQCLIKLDIQTGSLLVRFPAYSSLLPRPIKTETDKNEAKNNAYCLMARVAEHVTRKIKPRIGQLATIIDLIYPEFVNPKYFEDPAPDMQLSSKKRCVYGVLWRFWGKPSPFEIPEEGFNRAATHPREWLLMRQPSLRIEHNKPAHHMIYPSSRTLSLVSPTDSQTRDSYQLFDGLFWIRLRNRSADTLILRIFEKEDLRHLSTAQQEKEAMRNSLTDVRPHRLISAAFALLKPTGLQFTMPAVFRKDSTTGEETLVGFPTLDVGMNGLGAPDEVCDWSVRYRKINFGNRGAGDIIVPGILHADMVAEEKRQRLKKEGIIRSKLRQSQVSAPEEEQSEAFTGYKRGSHKARVKRAPRKGPQTACDKWAMEGEDAEGLGFLEADSWKQEGSLKTGKKGVRQ